MTLPPVITQTDPPLATVQLHRPDRMNAVTLALYRALDETLERIATDSAVRAVVLTGAGRAFCVGADLKAHGSSDPTADERRVYVTAAQQANRRLQTLPQPVVAAVNGHAIGAGLELALSCDIIVVSDDAKLRLPELSLGTFVGGGVSYTLARRVGAARAREVIMLGEFITPARAVDMGMVNRTAPGPVTLDTATQIAARLAAQAPLSIRLAKELLRDAEGIERDRILDREAEALLRCMETEDWREGIRAFEQKRDPVFRGE